MPREGYMNKDDYKKLGDHEQRLIRDRLLDEERLELRKRLRSQEVAQLQRDRKQQKKLALREVQRCLLEAAQWGAEYLECVNPDDEKRIVVTTAFVDNALSSVDMFKMFYDTELKVRHLYVLEHFGKYKIRAIKVVRDYYGFGLKESKSFVEEYPKELPNNDAAHTNPNKMTYREFIENLREVGALVAPA